MDPNQYFVHMQMRNVAAHAQSAEARLRQARTLREVVQLGSVPMHPVARPLRHAMPELRRLAQAQGRRACELVDTHLQALEAQLADPQCPPAERLARLRTQISRYQHTEWCFLRGNFPALSHYASREAQRLVHRARTEVVGDPA